MKILLLTTTRNRRDALGKLLESLTSQTFKDFTLLLGDQNPEGFLDDILSAFAGTIAIERRRLSPMGLSAARNILLQEIGGRADADTIIALTDDDCWYAPDALENVAQAFGASRGLVALIGNANGKQVKKARKGAPAGKYGVFDNAPSWVLFMRANVVQEIGEFDANMGIGCDTPWQSGEETDYLLRVLRAYPHGVERHPEIVVYHPDTLAAPDKVKSYAAGRMYLLHKHKCAWWFVLLNILYPLITLPVAAWKHGRLGVQYRWGMFIGRLRAWWRLCAQKLL